MAIGLQARDVVWPCGVAVAEFQGNGGAPPAGGDLEGVALLDAATRMGIFDTARVSLRVSSELGRREVRAGLVVHGQSTAAALRIAEELSLIARALGGAVPCWPRPITDRRDPLLFPEAVRSIARLRVVPGDGRSHFIAGSQSTYSPLVEALADPMAGAIVSCAILPSFSFPRSDLVVVSDRWAPALATLAVLEAAALCDDDVQIRSEVGLSAERSLYEEVDLAFDDESLLSALVFADLYAAVRTPGTGRRLPSDHVDAPIRLLPAHGHLDE